MSIKDSIKNPSFILPAVTGLSILIVTIMNYVLSDFGYTSEMKSFYNNYLIFKGSFQHLLSNDNLYIYYFDEGITDLFKYSPTFALFFGLFAWLPDFIGLLLWNCLNALVFVALAKVKWPTPSHKWWAWAFVLVEFITQTQNSQSNGLVAGLMILTFVYLERNNMLMATLMVVLSVYVKLFGLVAFALFMVYPNKSKAILYSAFWAVILLLLPLIVVSPLELITQYQNWWQMLIHDAPGVYSPSVAGFIEAWTGYPLDRQYVLLFGVVLFLIPLMQNKLWDTPLFRKLILASVLIWVVIFNHKAESPTFVIAVAGVAIWYFSQPYSTTNRWLLIATLIFTQLSPTDLFPSFIRNTYFMPYVVKVIPVMLVWFKVLYDTLNVKRIKNTEPTPVANSHRVVA